jgi:nitrogenase subunit NifH
MKKRTQNAIYGKGGIEKSTTSSSISVDGQNRATR